MPIKYKVIQRVQPGVSGGGDKKYYATNTISGEKTLVDLTKEIEKISTVSGADIRAVLYALVDVMQSSLADGNAVRLGELGSLRVSISSEGKATEKEVTAASIRGAKVIFTPGKDLKKMLDTLEFQKE
ncbi:HU family DNA-binding protein [Capnocytophaga cynodegmi]|uniref:Putative DNA-binding protein, histone-like n=1 Tax=Capnocytophaga cynodegmi TaxID=28189 RepID=A0A0B7HNZ8_9FLAO|nr:HU family DNA-binding protein [Capnocytophaga cynodegmi]CEN40364.1 putative DNA-binding protein, histone-like [Capnocytophaga cynodegmi]